jgi:hypothetical protein|tara:strand:- start:18166 stop:18528 length:363 start_codon:yes stop_codon:yes gene_type:complete
MSINSCHGLIIYPSDTRLNEKQSKLSSSHHTQHKKILNVIRSNDGENQTQTVNNNCPNNKQISNVGGPGDRVQSIPTVCCFGTKQKNRLIDRNPGVDVKHNSYERYLARKKGYIFQQQIC